MDHPQRVGDQIIPIVKECDVGRSDSGYVVLRIEGGTFAFSVNAARSLAREIVKQAELIAKQGPAN